MRKRCKLSFDLLNERNLILGEDKIGRTRLLKHINNNLENSSIRVIYFQCQFEERFVEYGLLRSLLRQVLQFDKSDKTRFEREEEILRLFEVGERKNLFLLNDLLDVEFGRSQSDDENLNSARNSEKHLNEVLMKILEKNIEQLGKKEVFIVDDIHFGDESSLKHLLTLGKHKKSLLILSMKPPTNNNNDRPQSNSLQSIRTNDAVFLRRLPGLELRYLPSLACQILSVSRIPTKLIKIFNESCNGIPGFCEQILLDLLSKEKLFVSDKISSDTDEKQFVDGDPEKLVPTRSDRCGLLRTFFSRPKTNSFGGENQRIFSRQCFFKDQDQNDFQSDFKQNFQNYIMCRIDRLSEGESLLVKIGAVIGNSFSRSILWHLVDGPSKKLININSCILEIMERTVIECAHSKEQTQSTRSIKCFCLQNPAGFPSQCRLMAFTHSTIREGIYNSLTDSLRRLIIRNAIDYLERISHIACLTCSANRYDYPFLVHDRDGLAKIIQNSKQQCAFVDIVRLAALKEIDNQIKQITRGTETIAKEESIVTTTQQSVETNRCHRICPLFYFFLCSFHVRTQL